MLSQKSYYRKDIETRKMMKSKEKIKLYPEKSMVGVISLPPIVSNYEIKIRRWE